MDNEAMLLQLLDACEAGRRTAAVLAGRTDSAPLRALLRESALQYTHAADEIREAWCGEARAPRSAGHADRSVDSADDVLAQWESVEGETLTYFRDAYDTALPPELADSIRRHLEAGIRRLEQLRRLHAIDA